MAQHDAARADPQMPGLGRHQSHHDLRRATGKPGRTVVLGQPIAAIAEAIGMAGKLDGFEERVARGHPFADRRLVEDAQLDHGSELTQAAPKLARPLPNGPSSRRRSGSTDPRSRG